MCCAVEAKFSFCFNRVGLIDCLAFEARDFTTAQHVQHDQQADDINTLTALSDAFSDILHLLHG